jgi:hypothetical protein
VYSASVSVAAMIATARMALAGAALLCMTPRMRIAAAEDRSYAAIAPRTLAAIDKVTVVTARAKSHSEQ